MRALSENQFNKPHKCIIQILMNRRIAELDRKYNIGLLARGTAEDEDVNSEQLT